MTANAESLLDRLARVLGEERDVVLAIVFGSVVAGNADVESDVDVAVWTDPALDHERKRDLRSVIALATGRPVDLVDLLSARRGRRSPGHPRARPDAARPAVRRRRCQHLGRNGTSDAWNDG